MKKNLATLLMDGVNGSTFIGLDTITDVKLKGGKKNPQQGHIQKETIGSNVMVFQNKNGSSYERMVQRRLEKEGKDPSTFVLSPRKWGRRLTDSPFIEHNGQFYIEVIFLHKGKTQYLLDGNPIKKEDIIGLQESVVYEDSQGGLDNKVIIRSYKVDSIKSIKINKQTYSDLTFNLPH